jgi:hypothetical protein
MQLTPPNNLSAVSLTPVNSFSAVSPVSLTPLNSLSLVSFIREYLREFSKKFKTAPMEYLGAWGTLIHEKNLSWNF